MVSFVVIVVPMVLKPPLEDAAKSRPSQKISAQAQEDVAGDIRASRMSSASNPGEPDASASAQLTDRHAVERKRESADRDQDRVLAQGAVDAARTVQSSQVEATQVRRNGPDAPKVNAQNVSSNAASGSKMKAWAVQLGSFSKRGNAVALRDRLQAGGYPAFVKPTTENDGGFTRVFVGPQSSKEQARQLSRTLGEETRLKGLIVPYP